MALNTILSHPNQDSYVTVAEADSYLSIKTQHTIWSSLNTTAKEGYLRQAAIQMDSFRYKSIKLYERAKDYRQEQGLAFPRYFFENKLYSIYQILIFFILPSKLPFKIGIQ